MRSPATTHAWPRLWPTNKLPDGEPPNGSCPLPHTGSCFAGSPSGQWPCQASAACSVHGSSPAPGAYPDSGIVTSAIMYQGAGHLRDSLSRHAITIKQETGGARRRELWDAQDLDLDRMVLNHCFRDRTSQSA